MNLGQHALKILNAPKRIKKIMPAGKGRAALVASAKEVEQIIAAGGNITTICKEIGVSHHTVTSHLNSVLGDGAIEKAKHNGLNRKR